MRHTREFFLWLIPVAGLSALAAVYFWPRDRAEQPQLPAVASPKSAAEVRYPVQPPQPPAASLPALADSDAAIRDAAGAVLGQRLSEFLFLTNIIHRVVATVDNLPRDHVAPKLMPVKPVSGVPVSENSGESLVLSPRNAARYQAYVSALDAVRIDALLAVYARFYPLFQEQYEKLGYPDKYFNDRAVEVIDHLLATPEASEPMRLVQPGVLYEFADPKLETLSAGQKILLRMGKANRIKLKPKLQELRQALVSMTSKE